ncbi:MAG TPA: hypothetical protein VIW92_00315 [Thermoanaerobaculia bacterium]
MRALARWARLLALSLLALPLEAAQAPALEVTREGVVLTRLPLVLTEPEIRKQLDTGLTTSFVFQATAKGGGARTQGAARVDVRRELWDEIYLVSRIDASGKAQRITFPSFERLSEWWRDSRVVVLRSPVSGSARSIEVRLKIIPFSQSEQLDAQRWFSQLLSAEKSGSAGAVSDAVEDQPESFSQILNLLMATSIGRHALLEYEWKLAIPIGPTGRKK